MSNKGLPKYIKEKLVKHREYTLKANNLQNEVEDWFAKQGLQSHSDLGIGSGTFDEDTPITDILIDNGYHGNVDETVELLEEVLRTLKGDIDYD